MIWPVVQLAFWSPGDPRSDAIDRLVGGPEAPLARLGLSAIAATYAESHGISLAPSQQWWANLIAAKSLAVDGALTDLVPALDDAGIPFFVAKGPSMISHYSDSRLRGYTDLDVYVEPRSLADTRRVLGAFGYRPVDQRVGPLGGLPRELHGGRFGAVVEVHGDAIDNLHRRWLPPITDYLAFVERTSISGVAVPTLSTAAHLCLQAVHLGAGHRYARLGCYRDVELLAPAIDPELVQSLGATPYLRTQLAVLQSWGRAVPTLSGGTSAHRRLVAELQSDPLTWDEFRPSLRNVLALANQPTARAAMAAMLAAIRALLPERGRRVPAFYRPQVTTRRQTRSHT